VGKGTIFMGKSNTAGSNKKDISPEKSWKWGNIVAEKGLNDKVMKTLQNVRANHKK